MGNNALLGELGGTLPHSRERVKPHDAATVMDGPALAGVDDATSRERRGGAGSMSSESVTTRHETKVPQPRKETRALDVMGL